MIIYTLMKSASFQMLLMPCRQASAEGQRGRRTLGSQESNTPASLAAFMAAMWADLQGSVMRLMEPQWKILQLLMRGIFSSDSLRSMSALGFLQNMNSLSPSLLRVTNANAVLACSSQQTPSLLTLFFFNMSTNMNPNSSFPTCIFLYNILLSTLNCHFTFSRINLIALRNIKSYKTPLTYIRINISIYMFQ